MNPQCFSTFFGSLNCFCSSVIYESLIDERVLRSNLSAWFLECVYLQPPCGWHCWLWFPIKRLYQRSSQYFCVFVNCHRYNGHNYKFSCLQNLNISNTRLSTPGIDYPRCRWQNFSKSWVLKTLFTSWIVWHLFFLNLH